MTVKEIRELINNFYICNKSKEELVLLNSQIESIKDDPLFLEVLVKQISNEAFYYIVEKFNIPENIVHQRQELQINILKNPLNYPLTVVQNALCDILFHNNPKKNNSGLSGEMTHPLITKNKIFE